MNYRSAVHEAIAKAFTGRFFGYQPDSDVKRRQKDASLRIAAPTTEASLVDFEGPILNQGQTGSCVGHGTAQVVFTSMNAAGTPNLFMPSPLAIYQLARILERTTASQGLSDGGAMPSDVLTVLRQYGVKPINAPTPDGRYSDVWGPADLVGLPAAVANVNSEPDLFDLERSGMRLLTGEYRIDEVDPRLPQSILNCLGTKATAGVGIFVDEAFMQWDPASGPITGINLRDPKGGGHWLACTYGYTRADGSIVLGGPNSWGKTWPVTASSTCPGSPFWKPGHWEVTAAALQAAMSDCLLFPVQVLS